MIRGEVNVRQVLVIPALELSISRTISPTHPRQPWKFDAHSLDRNVWGEPSIANHFDTPWASRGDAEWHLTTDVPVMAHVTDDEAHDLIGGEVPRNVTLRYQRAIAAHNAVLVGAGARSLDDVRADFDRGVSDGTFTIAKAPSGSGSVEARVTAVLDRVAQAVRDDKTAMLDTYVPKVARAKGAGPHRRDADALPKRKSADDASAPEAPAFVAAAAPEGEALVKAGQVLVRPNGMEYHVRAMDDMDVKISDVAYYRQVHAAGIHTLLWGAPGTGKTAGFEVAFPGMILMLGTPEVEATDFYGTYVAVVDPDTGRESLVWEDGPLTRAAEAGKVLFIDEVGLIPSNQIAPLLGVMDGRREFTIPQNPARGTIKVAEGFGVVGAFNPSTARNMSEALLSRFGAKLEHTTDFAVARKMGVNSRLVDAAEHMEAQRASGELGASPQMRELLQFRQDETMLGTVYALRNMINNAPDMERDLWVTILREKFGDIPGAMRKIRGLAV